ncbi:hypothetical protein M988_2282 [Hafnia paralvei ATCC 29927]|uniref:hypothetical protein n=1 Tax=Hafnia paralvei TaxID=546367 RepID=UPI0007E2FBD9|nr:hypothetical protein [Hafnia paralvei]OAT41105.1 hypothetical protein M988_2282 [Hafnia paralvei ATCC 29927]
MEKLQASLLTPAKQGELDSLCGLYSVINTLYWFYGQKVRRKPLFRALVHHLSQHSSIADYLTNGMESPQIDCLLHFLQTSRYKRYPITVYRPFLTQPNVSTKAILAQCQEWLEHNHGVILLGDQYHWSVVTHIDDDWLCFFDSGSRGHIHRHRWSLRQQQGKYQLFKDAIYFIEQGEQP